MVVSVLVFYYNLVGHLLFFLEGSMSFSAYVSVTTGLCVWFGVFKSCLDEFSSSLNVAWFWSNGSIWAMHLAHIKTECNYR